MIRGRGNTQGQTADIHEPNDRTGESTTKHMNTEHKTFYKIKQERRKLDMTQGEPDTP